MHLRFVIIFFTAILLIIRPAEAQTNDYIIVFRNHSQKREMLKHPAFAESRSFNIIPAMTARLDAGRLKELRQNPDVAFIEPDYKIYALGSADDINSSSSNIEALLVAQVIPYGVSMVNAPAVWSKTKGAGAIVAVLDTGISMYHPDRGSVIGSVSFVADEVVEDFEGHGTHTSGTIAAADNDIGVAGVAPQADLLIAKVLDNSGEGQTSWLISGIEWAVENGADVISMSLGSSDYSASLETACNNAYAAGVLLVAAAGNDNTSTAFYPAAFSSVISVMAVDQNKSKASFSNYGSTIELAAPGVSIYSTVPVSSDALADAIWSDTSHQANTVKGTAAGEVSGTICNCGLANGAGPQNTCPDSVAGNIAHIRRGTITFAEKVAHAMSKGAIGVIISNNISGNFNGTLNGGSPLVVVSVSKSDGDELQTLAQSGITGTVSVESDLYEYKSGTSMACPHVAGVAALIFAADGYDIISSEVRNILINSAQDLGAAGRDNTFGYGLVDAQAAINLIVPQTCGAVWTLGYGKNADINRDCFVGWEDLQLLVEQWLNFDCSSIDVWCSGGDIDRSGSVNIFDLSNMAAEWLKCNDPQQINCE